MTEYHIPFHISHFSAIEPHLSGKRVLFRCDKGNSGDDLIIAGTAAIFKQLKIEIVDEASKAECFVWGGGGNLGTVYKYALKSRRRLYRLAAKFGKPVVILPQSITDIHESIPASATVFLRELSSLATYPSGRLAPDMSFAFDGAIPIVVPTRRLGLFLRSDREGLFQTPKEKAQSLGDPAMLCRNWMQYLALAGEQEHLITDRLHFAVAGLIMNRKVTLLPNVYHKNRSMYSTWLNKMNCEWSNSITSAFSRLL